MYDCIIIGAGPAGLSAALYTVRAGMKTLVIAAGPGALGKVDRIDNYFGFAETVSGEALLRGGTAQLARLGGEFASDEVTDIQPAATGFELRCASGSRYETLAVLLATGKTRATPRIEGLPKYEGAGVSRCAVCDGFFFRGRAVGVLGAGQYALSEARELVPLASEVTVFTNGAEPEQELADSELRIDKRRIVSLYGDTVLEGMAFDDGSHVPTAGLFIAVGTAGGSELGIKLGAETAKGSVVTDASGACSVPGLFAAGDCTGAPYQISISVGEGARAGLAMAEFCRKSR